MKKLFLTDLTLHTKEQRPTQSLEKAVQKTSPRFYTPKFGPSDIKIKPDGTFEMAITLPPDVMAGIESGEIKLEVPEGGTPIYAGKDVIEKIRQMERQKTNEIIHREKIAEKKRSIL